MNVQPRVDRNNDPMFPDLTERSDIEELMDITDCDTDYLLRTVEQFARINRLVSCYRRLLTRYFLDEMSPGTTYHVVDLGAGGCDIPAWLIHAAKERGVIIHVTALDADRRIVDWARNKYSGLEELTILNRDIFTTDRLENVDYIMGNHVLHHLPNDVIVPLLKMTTEVAGKGFLFNDIHRLQSSYLAYSLMAKLFFRNSFAYIDGRRSIRKGFRLSELESLVEQAGIADKVAFGRAVPGRVFVRHITN